MKYLLMIVLLFSFSQARAEQRQSFYSGNELLEMCEAYLDGGTSTNIAKGNTCFGYVTGISDTHTLFVSWELMEQQWCKPENMQGVQLVRIATKYLQENPQALYLTADSLVATALILAFPCE